MSKRRGDIVPPLVALGALAATVAILFLPIDVASLAAIPGDANADGVVDFKDQTAVLNNWGATGPPDARALYVEVDSVVYGTDPNNAPRIVKRLIEADAISGVERDFIDPARSVLLVGPYRTLVTIQLPYERASLAVARLRGRAIVPLDSLAAPAPTSKEAAR